MVEEGQELGEKLDDLFQFSTVPNSACQNQESIDITAEAQVFEFEGKWSFYFVAECLVKNLHSLFKPDWQTLQVQA